MTTKIGGDQSQAEFVLTDGTRPFAANQSFGGNKGTNLATPTASTDAATKGYVDGVAANPPSSTVVAETSFGQASTVGVATAYSRGDHTHGSPALASAAPTTSAAGDVAAVGAGTVAARTDHLHGREAFATPVSIGSANAAGAATTIPRSDHVHNHDALDTDTGLTSRHHTLGSGSNQAAAGDHTHTLSQHDHTGSGDGGILTNDEHDGYMVLDEIAAPSNPGSNKVRLYAKDTGGGVTELYYKNDAGTERDLSASAGGLTGHNHTAGGGDGGVLTDDEHDGFSEYTEISSPTTPAANKVRVYAKDTAGVSKLFYKDDAGTEVGPLSGAGANHNLLDGSVHPDTLSGSVTQGDLIIGNATPKWARLALGAANKVLGIVSSLPAWVDSLQSLMTAKGDLISASAANTPARLAVGSNNQVLTADSTQALGMKWAAVSASAVSSMALFTIESTLTVRSGTVRIYNKLGRTVTISQVFLAVGTAPTGAAVIVDVNKNGTTIFTTQANRPQIAAAAFTGTTTTIDVPSWVDGEYLTMDIDQIGSSVAGADLSVHIIYS